MRSLVRGGILTALVLFMTTPGPAVAAGGGGKLDGSAAVSPGLSNTAQPFTYNFGGDLTSRQSNPSGGPAPRTVAAGRGLTDPAPRPRIPEPPSARDGDCADGT